jgi:hypothetical protein
MSATYRPSQLILNAQLLEECISIPSIHRRSIISYLDTLALNEDPDVPALYNLTVDVALLPLQTVKTLASTKLHVITDNHSSWRSWDPATLLIEDDIVVLKIGAKTGITVGTYCGIVDVKDTNSSDTKY